MTTPGRCTQIALTGRVDTGGTELTSVTTTVRSEDGAAKSTLGPIAPGWRAAWWQHAGAGTTARS